MTEAKRPSSAGSPINESTDCGIHSQLMFDKRGYTVRKSVFDNKSTASMANILRTVCNDKLPDSYIGIHYHPELLEYLFGTSTLRKPFKELLRQRHVSGIMDGADIVKPKTSHCLPYVRLSEARQSVVAHIALGKIRLRVLSGFLHFAALYDWYGIEKGKPCDFTDEHLEQFNNFLDAYRKHDDSSMDLSSPRSKPTDDTDAARAKSHLQIKLPFAPQRLAWETMEIQEGDVFMRSLILPTYCEATNDAEPTLLLRVTYSPARPTSAQTRAFAHQSLSPPPECVNVHGSFRLTDEQNYICKLPRDKVQTYIRGESLTTTVWQQLGYKIDGTPFGEDDLRRRTS